MEIILDYTDGLSVIIGGLKSERGVRSGWDVRATQPVLDGKDGGRGRWAKEYGLPLEMGYVKKQVHP